MVEAVQKPLGPKGIICPLLKQDASKVCHKCMLWTRVMGANPQTGEMVDKWDCAFALMPMLTIENSMMQRQTGAAVESFRNEVVRASEQQLNGPRTPRLVG